MAQTLRTVLIQDLAVAADGPVDVDLPVNPLSMILLTIKALNDTAAAANYARVAQLLAMVPTMRVTYRGASILDGSLTDLAILMARLTGAHPTQIRHDNTDNNVRAITVPLLFGRRPYDPRECFPATRRGDFKLHLDVDVAVTGLDTFIVQAETVELLEAHPERFIKATTISQAFNATGEHDVELPIGNDLLGILLFDPVTAIGASYNAWWGLTRIQVDNVETMLAAANWESLHGELLRKHLMSWPFDQHGHGFVDAAAGQTNTQQPHSDDNQLGQYAYIDLDPLGDGQYALKTKGAARLNLRTNTETATATAARALPVELIEVPGAGAAPA